uniref:SJCHGC04046 protein n=1 Tax=Schistosoma japonicum TaxID=6182 RepID=Q5DBT9_SCHJA|nr:SJCHGC04046 protein [Schistosoma japonicum]
MFLSVFFICNILLCTTSTFKLVKERSANEDNRDSHNLVLSKLQSDDDTNRYYDPDLEVFNISSPFINEQLRNQMDILKQELEETAKKLNHVPNSCNSNLYNGLLVSICIGLFSIITLV